MGIDPEAANGAIWFVLKLLFVGGIAIGLAIAFVVIPAISWLCHHVKVV